MVKYNNDTKAEEIANQFDLTGKNILITGGYAGMGEETTRVLAQVGAHVIVAGRDLKKAQESINKLKKESSKQLNISALEVDLGSFESIHKFADEFNKLNLPLHYLILNAGIMATPEGRTKDGFELQFGTNFLGHFLLTNLLIPRLLEAAPSRVVSVSSAGHAAAPIFFDDYNFEKKPYNGWLAYGQSKTGNILFANEFNKKYSSQGITANSLHPGNIFGTDLVRHLPKDFFSGDKMPDIPGVEEISKFNVIPKSLQQGAATSVFCALVVKEGGKFYDSCTEVPSAPHASDPEAAERLWNLATKLTKL